MWRSANAGTSAALLDEDDGLQVTYQAEERTAAFLRQHEQKAKEVSPRSTHWRAQHVPRKLTLNRTLCIICVAAGTSYPTAGRAR